MRLLLAHFVYHFLRFLLVNCCIKATSVIVFLFYLFKIREPFSIMSLLKSPMGLMVGFMVIMMFVMPKMMDNIGKQHSIYIQKWV
jgi:hypothetical protein